MSAVRRVTRVLSFVLLGGFFLLGSRCNYRPNTGSAGYSGASCGIAPAGPSVSWSVGSNPPTANASALLALLNAQRTANGMSSLVWHDGLTSVATLHSNDMANGNYLNLMAPEGYDVFQSLVAANPSIHFDDTYALVYAEPFPTTAPAVFGSLMANPAFVGALMDPAMTHWGQFGAKLPAQPVSYSTIVFGKNVVP